MSSKANELEPSHDADLPPYASDAPPDLQEHRNELVDNRGRAWLWLAVKSRAKSAKHPPFFFGGDTVSGVVELDSDKAGSIKSVSVALTGSVTAVGQEETVFLYAEQILWNLKTASIKPSGRQRWTFSITPPTEIVLPVISRQTPAESYHLPPSFSERASPAYIDYRICVTVRRGIFRANQTLASSIVYLPFRRADAPSLLRQAAYREDNVLIGPEDDPNGWKVLPSVMIVGTLFNDRPIELRCTLALAKPLLYPRGYPIPLLLTMTGTDEQALDLLSSAGAMRIHLVRSRVLGKSATIQDGAVQRDHLLRDIIGSAQIWLPAECATRNGVRTLHGEMSVKSASTPSFVFPGFSLLYHLVLRPPQIAGFSIASPAGEPLIEERVEITVAGALGVIPRSYAPPGYVQPGEADYNNAVGYLENGNQRFLHHGGPAGI